MRFTLDWHREDLKSNVQSIIFFFLAGERMEINYALVTALLNH